MIQRSRLRLGVFALLFALCFAAIGAGTVLAAQTYMINARNDLRSALTNLEDAQTNKGGHRVNAINLVKQAINEVNIGIQYAQ
jgi:hypothetical protein